MLAISSIKFEAIKNEMIAQAQREYGTCIKPCGVTPSLDKSFSLEVNEDMRRLVFWFNIPSRSTKVVTRELATRD
jgi:hypothetical protein